MQDAAYPITTVVAPAASRLLTSKEHVRDDLKIASGADDVFIDRTISSQSRWVEEYCNRVFARQDYQDLFRQMHRLFHSTVGSHDFEGLRLRNVPVTALTSVVEDDNVPALVLDTDFEADFDRGMLYRLDTGGRRTAWRADKIVVLYTAGYTLPSQGQSGESFTLPPDLEEAVIRLIKLRYLARGRDPSVRQENIPGVIEQTRWVPSGDQGNLPPDIREVLDQYRAPIFA